MAGEKLLGDLTLAVPGLIVWQWMILYDYYYVMQSGHDTIMYGVCLDCVYAYHTNVYLMISKSTTTINACEYSNGEFLCIFQAMVLLMNKNLWISGITCWRSEWVVKLSWTYAYYADSLSCLY